jgi:hypothetical protein
MAIVLDEGMIEKRCIVLQIHVVGDLPVVRLPSAIYKWQSTAETYQVGG